MQLQKAIDFWFHQSFTCLAIYLMCILNNMESHLRFKFDTWLGPDYLFFPPHSSEITEILNHCLEAGVKSIGTVNWKWIQMRQTIHNPTLTILQNCNSEPFAIKNSTLHCCKMSPSTDVFHHWKIYLPLTSWLLITKRPSVKMCRNINIHLFHF